MSQNETPVTVVGVRGGGRIADVARHWHEGSDHAHDGEPFGGPLCNCLRVSERLTPMLAQAWDEGRRAGVDDMIAAEVGSFRRRKPNPYRTTKEN